MARETKGSVILECVQIIEEFRKVERELDELIERGACKYGYKLAYGLHGNYGYRKLYGFLRNENDDGFEPSILYGSKRKNTKLWDFKYCRRTLLDGLEKLKEQIMEVKGGGK